MPKAVFYLLKGGLYKYDRLLSTINLLVRISAPSPKPCFRLWSLGFRVWGLGFRV